MKMTLAIKPASLELNTFSADLYKAIVAMPESKHWKSRIGINVPGNRIRNAAIIRIGTL
jgi:hypothetical protein